jgi:hypothetical protein
MATIITVHGTGATGPEEGDRWWQKGSPFEKHLRELVESEDGVLKFEPFVWDGANSEVSRRKSGEALYERLKQSETAEQSYVVVGHSHGGSVAAHALLDAAAHRNSLSLFRKWITVGTPFISFSNSLWLFAKLGISGKAAYVTIFSGWLMLLMLLVIANPPLSVSESERLLILVMASLMPLAIIYWVVRRRVRQRLRLYSQSWRARARGNFSSKWTALVHENDEALQGLRALRGSKLEIFPRDFGVPALTATSIFVLPVSILLLASSQALTLRAFKLVSDNPFLGHLSKEGALIGNYAINVAVWAYAIITPISRSIRSAMDTIGPLLPGTVQTKEYLSTGIAFLLIPTVLFVISLLVVSLVAKVARTTSPLLSKLLNRMTRHQMKQSMFGDDVLGERIVDAQSWPMWAEKGYGVLPSPLGDEISEFSNRAAADAIGKFRQELNAAMFRGDGKDRLEWLSGYMTWDELIHTSYFRVPRFRKLVAYAISTAEGFRATEVFKADPDYALVAKWFEEIQPQKELTSGDGKLSAHC